MEQKQKKKRSICLLISAILGVVYAIYLVSYFGGSVGTAGSSSEALGAGLATALVMPHMVCAALAAVFNVLGWAMNHRAFALVGAILYTVALVLFPMYFMFVVVQMILSYIGFAQLKKIKAANAAQAPAPAPQDPQL